MKKEIIAVDALPRPPFPSAPAVRAGGLVFASGQLATDFVQGLAPEARIEPEAAYLRTPARVQAAYVYRNLGQLFEAAGSRITSMTRAQYFVTGRQHTDPHGAERRQAMGDARPTSAALLVSGLLAPEAVLQVEGMAVVESADRRLEVIDTDRMITHRLAGYSKGLRFGDWLFTAGATAGDHVPVDPFGASTVAPEARVDPNYWVGSPIKRQVLYIVREKLVRVLEAAGCSLDDIVCAHVYLNDTANDYAFFNEAWQELFPEKPPSTVVVPVDGFGVVHAKAEISFVVVRPGSMPVDIVNAGAVPAFPGHAPQATRAGDMIWCSTLVAADAQGLLPSAVNPPGLPYFQSAGGRQMQTIVDNLAQILDAAGSDLRHVVKLLVYCSDLAELPAFVDVWRPAFADSPPAISVIQVKGPFLAPGCTVAVDAVAVAT